MLNNKNPNRGSLGVRRPGAVLVSLVGLALAVANPVPAVKRVLSSRNARRIGAVALVVLAGSAAVAYAVFSSVPGRIQVAPVSIVVHSATALPAEVQALEAGTVPLLFDRDTRTVHVAFADQHIDATLDRPTEIRAIKVYGPAPYELTVSARQGGAWTPIPGLSRLRLGDLDPHWNTFAASQPVTTDALRFELTLVPAKKGKTAATGLAELEIWGTGEHALVSGAALVGAMQTVDAAGGQPAQARAYAATPESGVVGQGGQTFRFTLDRPAARFKHAWLAYETWGLTHWVSPVRRINGLAVQGGNFAFAGSEWTPLVEPIHPDWLVQGDNRIAFTLPPGAGGTYSVRNVKIIGELDDGANFIARATTTVAGIENDTPALIDGDMTSEWSPYADPRSKAGKPELTLYFDRPTQLDTVSMHLTNALAGTLSVELRVDGQWQTAGLPTVNGNKLSAGWNALSGFAPVAADALRIIFLNGQGSSGEIREIAATGSGVAGPRTPDIVVAYPDAGQFYGRQAYLRGFLAMPDNGSGPAVVSIGERILSTPDGGFGVVVAKDDVGYANQADGEAWQVRIDAVYPDGQKLARIVRLTQQYDAARTQGVLPSVVNPGFAAVVVGGDASLDIDPDALDKPIDIKITPLKEPELPPLDPGMTNVTPGSFRGYRFTPHGAKFKKHIKVTIPYDPALIPSGLNEQDIKTYFFDTELNRWVVLDRYRVDSSKRKVTSLTNHFTDMINATLTVPDHPETTSYNATQMKDIKAADPGAGINLIEPPQANNMGDARLSYPIEIPPGRLGMQPQLAVQYNSAGGNGWMGMGWDLSTPSITIDTRWGVPRYEADKESETYLLNGEMLTPVAHRGALQPRSAEKVFHTRVEGQFRKIVRHGDHPANYWWEVTDKNGTRFIYGADPAIQQRNEASTLADGKGNGFLWVLREMRDTHGNFVRYHYAQVSDTGVTGGTVPGANLYLKRITYTGSGDQEGAYEVVFVRDRELGEPLRTDKQIDARGAFKRVTADRLRKVNVSFNGQPVRAYEFLYAEGAFHKTLLQRVVQFDEGGREFNRHEFGYYDEARDDNGVYRGFAASSDWAVGADNVSAGLMGKGVASALGGSRARSAGGHLYVGVGTGTNVTSKTDTVGAKLGYTRSTSETLLAMADMDGDGLPDKVFKSDGRFHYRPNLAKPGGIAGFGEPVALPSLPAIGRETVKSATVGVESYFKVSILKDRNVSETRTNTYFSDVNGDGLTDLVSGGHALFGFRNAAGVPTFSANSLDTPVPVGSGAVDTANLLEDAAAVEAKRAADFPLLDSLRRWVAPYDGVIAINAPVRLIKDTSPARDEYTGADGVRVAIQLEGAELWATTIAVTDYAPHAPAGVNSIAVRRGDRLYFRVQSVFDGAYDQVAWDPEITYLSVDATRTDVNDLAEYRYQASSDFTLAGRRGTVTAPLTGTLHLGGTWHKTGATTDDVTLQITKNGAEVYRRTLGFAQTDTVTVSQDIAVAKLDTLEWRILVDSPIDASRIRLEPTAYYTAAEGVDAVVDDQGNHVIQVRPPFDMDVYPVSNLAAPQAHYVAQRTGTLPVRARLGLTDLNEGETAEAVLTVKRRGVLLAKRAISVTGTGAPVETEVTLDVPVTAGDQLFFDVTSRQATFLAHLGQLEVTTGTLLNATALPVAVHVPAAEGLFPQPYRGWGAAGYNGNEARAIQPIDQSLLVLNDSYDPNNAKVYPYAPQHAAQALDGRDDLESPLPVGELWGGLDELAWVKPGEISASRLGLDDIRAPRAAEFAGAAAVARISKSTNDASSLGGSIPVGAGSLSGSVSTSSGESRSLLDFQDMNGDRFPDVLGHGGTQFSQMTGGLEPATRNNGVGNARKNSNVSYSGSVGGTIPVSIGNGRANTTPTGGANATNGSQGNEMPSLGFGGDLGGGTSDTEYDLIDINGDGLPDRVYQNGTAALNLGYEFANAEPWNAGIINDGETLNAGVNMGFNIDSYSIGGGLNLGTGTSRSDETYADINGDGLPDKINAGNPLTVRLNTGAGFTTPIAWPGGHGKIAVDKHISLGGGAYFTFGFTLIKAKIVINPGVNFSTTMGRPELAFRDIDGDGHADHLFSEKDSELKVALNPIGRTNLLKSVARPLGARIDIEYQRDGNTYELPQSRWVMKKVAVFDGHPGDGVDTLVNTYKYEKGHYDRLERDFYGYGTVVQEQRDAGNVYRAVTQDFHTDSYYTKGLVKRELTTDGAGRPYLDTENRYVLESVDTGIAADPASTHATLFPALVRTERSFHEGGQGRKSTSTTFEYDAWGNVIRFVDAGDEGSADDVEALINYSTHCAERYIVGKPLSISVVASGGLMRERTGEVDCATGNMTRLTQSAGQGQTSQTDLAYTPNGNLRSVTGAANHKGQRYALAYDYDPAVATHVVGVADSFGYKSSAAYDYRFGKPVSTTDLNGNVISTAYDSFGRTVSIQGPYETGTSQATLRFAYFPDAAAPYAITEHLNLDAAGQVNVPIDTVLFTDGIKRVLQTKKRASVNGQTMMIVSGRTVFDGLGRTIEQYYPVVEPIGQAGTFNPANGETYHTSTAFDVLDRTVRTTLPDATVTTMAYGFGRDRDGRNQFQTVVTDANGNSKESYRDVRELITAVKEFNKNEALWTSYAYDPLKQIVQVKDVKGVLTKVEYDLLGRRTVIDNPDTGKTVTVYDAASNPVQKITANLAAAKKAISYDYDFNRLAAIHYPLNAA
ncbi:MAG: SpvB/TcaC N-terminal domain-containing protein, partial [Thiobacillus sp.]|uniref:SpvB/TcaC N-terminal domain-containing protein n=1 Tax=Thiobacillus sp. TaxID=924 RepID=UPI0028958597